MKTRVVKTTKGYVAQVWVPSGTKGWWFWKRPTYAWFGIKTMYFFLEEYPALQLKYCVFKTEEEAKERIEQYKEEIEKGKEQADDLTLLSSN